MDLTAITPTQRMAKEAALPIPQRLLMGGAALGASAVLGVAAWIDPSAAGIGTHTQLGIAPCSWPASLNIPCPSCGMTTAFACAADGRILDAIHAQPAGFLLAVATAGAAIACGYSALTGSRLVGALMEAIPARGWWIFGGMLLASWGYKAAVMRGLLP